jgi:hypothetical protein
MPPLAHAAGGIRKQQASSSPGILRDDSQIAVLNQPGRFVVPGSLIIFHCDVTYLDQVNMNV